MSKRAWLSALVYSAPLWMAFCAALLLAGCGYQGAINGFEQQALITIKAADDNTIDINLTVFCGMPYSAIVRNLARYPALGEAIQKLCGGATTVPLPSPPSSPVPPVAPSR